MKKLLVIALLSTCLVGCASSGRVTANTLSDPQATLNAYMRAWSEQNWEKMANTSTRTWVQGQDRPAWMLSEMYGFFEITEYEIEDIKVVSPVVRDITVFVRFPLSGYPDPVPARISGRMIRESSAYRPSRSGNWGVNPQTMSPKRLD